MPLPWLALGKLVAGNLDTIVNVAKPLLTRKKVESPNQTELLNQQISELQAASLSNSEQIKALAAQLKQVVTSLEQAAVDAEAGSRRMRRLAIAAVSISLVSLAAAIVSMLAR
jgi:hypothetical protein